MTEARARCPRLFSALVERHDQYRGWMNGSNEGCVQRRLQRALRTGAGRRGGHRPPVPGLDHRAHPDRLLGAPVGLSGRLHVPDERRRDHGPAARSRPTIGLHARHGRPAATGNGPVADILGQPARQGHQGAGRDPHERHAPQGPPVGDRRLPDLQHRAPAVRDSSARRHQGGRARLQPRRGSGASPGDHAGARHGAGRRRPGAQLHALGQAFRTRPRPGAGAGHDRVRRRHPQHAR